MTLARSGALLKLLGHGVLSVNAKSSFPPLFLESFSVSPEQFLKMRVWGKTSHETFEHLPHSLISFANSPIDSKDTGCDRTHSTFAYQAPFLYHTAVTPPGASKPGLCIEKERQ